MGKPLALAWCRRCVAAHPEGQHLSRPAPRAEIVVQSRLHDNGDPPGKITGKTNYKHLSMPMEAKPSPANAVSAVAPARAKSFTPAVKRLSPTAATPSTVSRTSASSAPAGISAAAKPRDLPSPIAMVLDGERAKIALAHKRKIKAAQMRRFRAASKKRKQAAAKAAKAAAKGKKK